MMRDLTGKLVTLRGDANLDDIHNMYVVTEDDPTSPLVGVMHTKRGNVSHVRRGRCIPVVDAESSPVVPSRVVDAVREATVRLVMRGES